MSPPRTYDLTTRTEQVGSQRFELVGLDSFERASATLYRQVDPRLGREARNDLSPMFGVIWGSCRALALRLDALGPGLRGHRILELACGLALPSLVAARHGAQVVASDQHPDTAAFLERNLARNALDGVSYAHLDLRHPPHLGRFDLVLASDVLFAMEMPGIVARAFAHLLAPGGEGWLADPGRAWLEECVDEARACGLDVTWELDRVPTPTGHDDIFVVRLRAPTPRAADATPRQA